MSTRIYDISPTLTPSISVFPGDTPLSREVLLDMRRGDPLTLSTLRTTVHVGAHADAPSHYAVDGPTIDQMPLDHFLGPCQVIHVPARRGRPVHPEHLTDEIRERRILIRTGTQPDKRTFNPDFAPMSVELIDHLHARDVITIAVDTPSVDHATSKDLPVHAACARTGIAIIEGLQLDAVPPGRYELIALPLPLAGFDASPVRAILRPLDQG